MYDSSDSYNIGKRVQQGDREVCMQWYEEIMDTAQEAVDYIGSALSTDGSMEEPTRQVLTDFAAAMNGVAERLSQEKGPLMEKCRRCTECCVQWTESVDCGRRTGCEEVFFLRIAAALFGSALSVGCGISHPAASRSTGCLSGADDCGI